MPYYEWMFLADAGLTRSGLASLVREVSMQVMGVGGVVTRLGHLASERGYGPRLLAYTITHNQKKHKAAYYLQMGLFLNPRRNVELGSSLRTDKRVIRCFTLSKRLEFAVRPLPDGTEELPDMELDPDALSYERDAVIMDYVKKYPSGNSEEYNAKIEAMIDNQKRMEALGQSDSTEGLTQHSTGAMTGDALTAMLFPYAYAGAKPDFGLGDLSTGLGTRGKSDPVPRESLAAALDLDKGSKAEKDNDQDKDQKKP